MENCISSISIAYHRCEFIQILKLEMFFFIVLLLYYNLAHFEFQVVRCKWSLDKNFDIRMIAIQLKYLSKEIMRRHLCLINVKVLGTKVKSYGVISQIVPGPKIIII